MNNDIKLKKIQDDFSDKVNGTYYQYRCDCGSVFRVKDIASAKQDKEETKWRVEHLIENGNRNFLCSGVNAESYVNGVLKVSVKVI